MVSYLIKRLITGIISLFFLITITFILVHHMPGSPFETGNVSEQIMQAMQEEYGMDESLSTQYVKYLRNLLQGDLGVSMKKRGVAVNDLIGKGLSVTLKLGGLAFLASVVLGSLMGIWQLMSGHTAVRKLLMTLQGLGIGVPNFVIALLLMLFFGVFLGWFPVAGIACASNYVLPVAALATYPACVTARLVYSTARKEEMQAYVRFLEAKGLERPEILFRHIWRPVLVQMLACLGQILVSLLTGCFVVESVFTIPGLGREFVNAINNRDYTVVMGLTVFVGAVVIVTQIVLDAVQMYLDPRIRFGMGRG